MERLLSPRAALRHSLPRLMGRGIWAALLGLHVFLLVGGLAEPARGIGTQLALLLASVFFALKLFDLPALRVGSLRRAFVLYVVVTALVHQDVRAAFWSEAESLRPLAEIATVVVAGVVLRLLGQGGLRHLRVPTAALR